MAVETSHKIVKAELWLVDLTPETVRTDAIQSFVSQETPILKLYDEAGNVGTGYTYTIGTGGSAIISLLKDDLLPRLMGQDSRRIEAVWQDLFFSTHATTVGPITSLALAAIDIALWDMKCRRAGEPLHIHAGGAKSRIQLYDTEGGWLHLSPEEVAANAVASKAKGFKGVKIKVGKPHVSEDIARLKAVREAVGPAFEVMVDANQRFTVGEAIRRARAYEAFDVAWFEEPIEADDVEAHRKLAQQTSIPIAVGESIYSLRQLNQYLTAGAASIVQVDVPRIGGLTPFFKCAHLAEAFSVDVAPHFVMELQVAVCCAVPNSLFLEYIPQMSKLLHKPLFVEDGYAYPSDAPGIGLDWNWEAVAELASSPDPIVVTLGTVEE